jgi:hypothetical protein
MRERFLSSKRFNISDGIEVSVTFVDLFWRLCGEDGVVVMLSLQ